LEVALVEGAAVAGEVFVVDDAFEEICDGFLAAVGAFAKKRRKKKNG